MTATATLSDRVRVAVAVADPARDSGHGWFGWLLLAVASGLLVLHAAAPVLAVRLPRVWWCAYGLPVTLVRLVVTWRRVMDGCGLSVPRKPTRAVFGRHLMVRGEPLRPVPPRPAALRVSARGLVLEVVLHPGQVPEHYTAAAEAFAHAWRVHAVRVTSPARGLVRLTLTPLDPLHGPAAAGLIPRQRAGSGSREFDPDELLRVAVGVREDGRPWVLDLRRVAHWLIVGATRSGKSTLIHALVRELAQRPVALVGIDCKGGMELSVYSARLSALACTRAEAACILDALVTVMGTRMALCREAGARTIWDLPGELRPVPVVVIVDEVAELYLMATRADKDEVAAVSTALVRLGQLGAALGVHLVAAGQRVGSDLGPGVTALRSQLAGGVCHRVSDPETAVMTLGDLNPDALTAAQAITPFEPGVAVTADDTGARLRARSHLVTTGQAEDTARAWAHLTPPLPELTRALPDPDPS